MPNNSTSIWNILRFFLRLILLTAGLFADAGFMSGCGSSNTTIIYENGSDANGGGDEDEGGNQITASTANTLGTPTIHFQTRHIDLLLSGGDSVPMDLNFSESGSIEVSSDLNY